MVIFASTHIDLETFAWLQAIGSTYDVQLCRNSKTASFDLPDDETPSIASLDRLDAIISIYKGLVKLKDFQTI